MKLKYEDYTKEVELLEKLSETLVTGSVAALDSKTLLYTRANLVHSATFSKTFILIRLNDGSNLVLNLKRDKVYWTDPDIKLNLGSVMFGSELLSTFESIVVSHLYSY